MRGAIAIPKISWMAESERARRGGKQVMRAFLVLVLMYVGAFFIAIQGSSQSPAEAAQQAHAAATPQAGPTVDAAKQADIRSLMELVGARDMVEDATTRGTEQFRENLISSVPASERGQQFINEFITDYQKKFNPDDVTNQLVSIYDKHFTDEEIKGLLQFYGSPLGQKFAAEMPKIAAETQAANRAVTMKVAKEVLQDLRREYPGIGAQARLSKPRAGLNEQAKQQTQTQPETQASASQP
jgi:uncharacterized protein